MGIEHVCAIKTDQTVRCWGGNTEGQASPPSGTFVDLATQDYSWFPLKVHTCGIKTNGEVACWGTNFRGQADPPEGTFVKLAPGRERTCAIRTDGTEACWGKVYR